MTFSCFPRFTCKTKHRESGRCWARTSDLCRVKAAGCSPLSTAVSVKGPRISQIRHRCIGCFYAEYRRFTPRLLHAYSFRGSLRGDFRTSFANA